MMLKLYHLIPFFILFYIQNQEFNVLDSVPDYSNYSIMYWSVCVVCTFLFVKLMHSIEPFEKLIIILSSVVSTKIILKVFEDNKYLDICHSLFISLFLISIRNNLIHHKYLKQGYIICILYTIFSYLTRKQTVTTALNDYFTVHCIFYLLK